MAESINNFVMNCLEVIFGIFIVCITANSFLGIDVLAGIRKLWEKITGCSSKEE